MFTIMRKFNITVNGKTYEVEVEEVGVSSEKAAYAPKVVTVAAPAASPAAAPVKAPAVVPANGKMVSAPMPGTILKINFDKGAKVKKGDVLCVLEAMKMENDIQAPVDGTVVAVHTSKGASVDTGAALITIG